MMRLQVIVNALNKRTAIPAQWPEPNSIAGVVLEGFSFIGEKVSSDEIGFVATGSWYRDRDGYFYWGGGLLVIEEITAVGGEPEARDLVPDGAVQFDPQKMSWGHQLYEIPFLWNDLGTKGKGVTVAVIDTGVDMSHEDLSPNIHPLSRSFVGDPKNIDDMDIKTHGTRMAGIIASAGKKKVFGVAPEARLLIVKATLKKNNASVSLFTDAIKFVTSIPEVDIVSISYTLENTPEFKIAIQNCIAANKLVVAAVGNLRDSDLPEDPDTFPSSYNTGKNNTRGDEVIAVGAFNKQGEVSSFSNFNSHLSLICPGEFVLTANGNNSVFNEDGTSISTAFTAGCLALMVSYSKMHNKPLIRCANAMLNTCDDVGPEIGHDKKSGFGKLNLRNAIARIK